MSIFRRKRIQDSIPEYRYVDPRRFSEITHHLDIAEAYKLKPSAGISINHEGPEVSANLELDQRARHYTSLVPRVLKKLDKKGLLSRKRPENSLEALETKLCLEEMTAIKVIFPPMATKQVSSLREIAIWFAEPAEEQWLDIEESPHRARGTYLYLMEAHWDTPDRFDLATSGYSALQKVFLELGQLIRNPDRIPQIQDERETLQSPLALLEACGGTVQAPRRIRTLYRPRLFSDDQYVELNGIVRRSHDLFAYPLFIALV
jgi:hypothetical protein